MRTCSLPDSAITIVTVVVLILLICQACDQTTPASQPHQETPATGTEAHTFQSTPTPVVYQVGAPSEETPVTSPEVQAALPTPELGFIVPHPTDFEDYLSGDTLALYRDLPLEYQEALQAYVAWGIARDKVDVVVAQKIQQWPPGFPPMSDVLTPENYKLFQEVSPRLRQQAFFLLYFYPHVLSTVQGSEAQQQAFELMLEKMQSKEKRIASSGPQSEPGTQEFEKELDTQMRWEQHIKPTFPRSTVTATAQSIGWAIPWSRI